MPEINTCSLRLMPPLKISPDGRLNFIGKREIRSFWSFWHVRPTPPSVPQRPLFGISPRSIR